MVLYDIHTHHIATRLAEQEELRQLIHVAPNELRAKMEANPSLYFSCGIHPWDIQDTDRELLLLEELASHKHILAIGEVGLDTQRGAAMHIQQEVLRQQVALAQQLHKPLIIHCVRAWDALIAIYKETKGPIPWIIHGYRGNIEQTKQLRNLGFLFSIGQWFNSQSLEEIPPSSLFCETDMSQLPIETIYQNVANALSISVGELAVRIEENAKRFFGG